jgi:hypothetical protein
MMQLKPGKPEGYCKAGLVAPALSAVHYQNAKLYALRRMGVRAMQQAQAWPAP